MIHQQRLATFASLVGTCVLSGTLFAAVPTEFQPNYDDGYAIGYPIGYDSGLLDGQERGISEGSSQGKAAGYDSGWEDAYQPSFDQGYNASFPVGHKDGWSTGVAAGFDEGITWAPVIAEYLNIVDVNNGGAGTINWGGWGSSSGVVMNSGCCGTMGGTLSISNGTYDWAAHYHKIGYDAGKDAGYMMGSNEGYKVTFADAFAAAFPVGYRNGTQEGTRQGTANGNSAGLDAGWDAGYGEGFDKGFYAGVDSQLFGRYSEPTYSFDYAKFGIARVAVPEPASFLLIGIAVVVATFRRWGRN